MTIVNHRQNADLDRCLASLRAHPYSGGATEVVIVDNACTSGSLPGIEDRFPGATVIRQSTWRGFGENQNTAIAASTGDLIFVLNPDASVRAGTLDALVEAMSDPAVAVAAGPVISSGVASRPRPFPTVWRPLMGAMGLTRWSEPRRPHDDQAVVLFEDRWVLGAAFLVRRSAFVSVGGFDADIFLYAEEVDLQQRLRQVGGLCAWVPAAIVDHVGQTGTHLSGSPQEASVLSVEATRGDLAYADRHLGRIRRRAMGAVTAMDAVLRIGVNRLHPQRAATRGRARGSAWVHSFHTGRLRASLTPRRAAGVAEQAAAWNAALAHNSSALHRSGIDPDIGPGDSVGSPS